MKKIPLFFMIVLVISCINESKNKQKKETFVEVKKDNFPAELGKVFEKHGGISTWKKAQTLSFNKGEEVHTVALHSRKTVVNTPKYSLGFDGKEVWLDEVEKGTFKGNPTFYYNLYFYFYAMPFVLADDGISYEKVADLVFEGRKYPGYKISFKPGKGTSPDDNYFVYYHPETYQMKWLGYTVTFFDKKVSNKVTIIKYNQWENVSGLLLPKEITWYKKDQNGVLTNTIASVAEFTLPLVSQGKLPASFYEKPVN